MVVVFNIQLKLNLLYIECKLHGAETCHFVITLSIPMGIDGSHSQGLDVHPLSLLFAKVLCIRQLRLSFTDGSLGHRSGDFN